jgi:rhodanese-related sulfurtransferase
MNPFKFLKSLFSPAPRFRPWECAPRVLAAQAVLIDVREPGEWRSGVAEGAVLLPLSDLGGARESWRPFLEKNAGRELLCYCAAGGRSAIAARTLVAEGFRAANAGSLGDWRESGWPVVPPRD